MRVPELIASGAQPKPLATADLAAEILEQAQRHTTRGGLRALLESTRPNESESVRDYRVETTRHLTQEGVKRYLNKVSRIFRSISVIDEDNVSKQLSEYLNSRPFYFAGRHMGIEDFFYSCVMQMAIEDPNAVLLAFPYNPDNPEVNPAAPEGEGGLSPTKTVGVKAKVVPSELLVYDNEHFIGWKSGAKMVPKGNAMAEANIFTISDTEAWYIVEPKRYEQAEGRGWYVVYDTKLWYRHDGGRPGMRLPGDTKKSVKGDYNESFLWIYYEYADEFISAFSDSQAVRIRHSYPKTIMAEVPCPGEGCNGGYVKRKDTIEGKYINSPCKICQGTGVIRDPGPHDTLVKARTIEGETLNDVLTYVTPDNSILDFSYNTPFDLLKRGKQAIGLDLLEGLNESGVAKEYRLEDLQDNLKVLGDAFTDNMESFLEQVEALLVVDDSSRLYPTLKRPEQYTVKSSYMLLEDAKEALPSDRVTKAMQYYRNAYKGDPETIRIFGLAHGYAPLFGLSGEELKIRLGTGVYGEKDVIRADRAVWVFRQLSSRPGFMTMEDLKAFEEADKILEPYFPDDPVPIYTPEGPPEPPRDDDDPVPDQSPRNKKGPVKGP